MAFLPPVPSGRAVQLPEPPPAPSNLFLQTPKFLVTNLDVPPSPTQLDTRMKRAEERFLAGKAMYQAGDAEGARREFDRAIDLVLSVQEDLSERPELEKRFEQMVATIHRYDVEGLGAGEAREEPAFDKSPLEDLLEMTFPIDPKLKALVKDELQATVSQLPLEMRDPVLGYIRYFSGERGRRTLITGLRRAGRYRQLISRILDEEGLPQELIFLAQAESGFLPRAVSRKQATGMWQFVQFRGRQYGLLQTPYTDDRLDPEKATRAAARHLRDLFSQFGDWYLAMAAYNCGPGVVERAVQRTGYADLWELRSRNVLPRETANYIPIIVAMTIMAKNAKDYGLEEVEPDPPLEYDSISVSHATNVALVADAADQPVSVIRELNPALLKNLAPPGYQLRVPKGSAATVVAALELVPSARRAAWRVHRVESGETLDLISRRYRTTVGSIHAANSPGFNSIEAGDLLVIPAAAVREVPAKALRASAKKTGTAAKSRAAKPGRNSAVRRPARRLPSRAASARGYQATAQLYTAGQGAVRR